MSDYIIHGETLEGIADAVRDMRFEKGTLTPAQMEAKIRDTKLYGGIDVFCVDHTNPVTGKWERPSEWPNVDLLTIGSDFDGLYLTYDLRKTPDYAWIGIWCGLESSGTFYLDRGHIENGTFVVDESFSEGANKNGTFRHDLDATYGNVQLWRLTANKHITTMGFATNSATQSECYTNMLQPCVERVGRLDYVSIPWGTVGAGVNDRKWGTVWLERDAVKTECLCKTQYNVSANLSGAWMRCYSLQVLEIEDWPVHRWDIPTFSATFYHCYSLKKLDLSKWDVSDWPINGSFSYAFAYMYSLEELDISTWDVSNWNVTTIGGAWQNDHCLRSLDLSNWDVSNWSVVSMGGTWQSCYSLVKLDISSWDVSNWEVTNFESAWSNCYRLVTLDLSDWDVSNWAVTTCNSTWYCCYDLELLDISSWDVSEWRPTSINSMFSHCHSIKSLDLSDWDVSDWPVIAVANAFSYMYSLESLDISSWDVSEWRPTSANAMFYGIYNMKSLDLSDWDVSNWVMSASDAWNYWIRYAYAMTELSLPAIWLVGGKGTNQGLVDFPNIQIFNGMSIGVNHSYSNSYMLTKQSLLNIIDRLLTVSSTKTITLGDVNMRKLTAEQIAVATQKGWTVA